MDFAEQAELGKLRGDVAQVAQLLQQVFDQESEASALLAWDFQVEPTHAVLHRSAAALAIDCSDSQMAEKLITSPGRNSSTGYC